MDLDILPDRPEAIASLAQVQADLIVTLGGASVGEHDLIQSALGPKGFALDFWKIAMRPGKPLLYGRLGNQRVLGLPGNPVSAFVCGIVFLVPMLHRLLGRRDDAVRHAEAILGQGLEANGPREHYMRAISTWTSSGERLVEPLAAQDSSLMADFARADCLIVRAPDAPALGAGARVTIIPLDD